MRDDNNGTITEALSKDPSRFTVYAEGEVIINDEITSVVLDQVVSVNATNNDLFIDVSITSVGTFRLYVKEGSDT